MTQRTRVGGAVLVLSLIWSSFGAVAAHADTLEQWLHVQLPYSTRVLLDNVGPSAGVPNAAPGAVIASQSYEPFYRYHWTRDGALTMEAVVGLYERATDLQHKARLRGLLADYVSFSRQNQLTDNPSGGADDLGLGEPKFNIDGSAFTGSWGRPQNDGPALRVSTLVHLARLLLKEGHEDWVRKNLYSPSLPARTVIKADLEFISHHWGDASFDLWEETKGDHFYTRLVQRRGLLDGAELAEHLSDFAAAQWYRSQAAALEPELNRHWDSQRGYLTVTLNQVGGLDYKSSGLDSAIVLAALHASPRNGAKDSFYAVTDDRILATAARIAQSFRQVYAVNSRDRDWNAQAMGVGIGRYPEDRYSGTNSSNQGNPWFLATNAYAELYYRCAKTWEQQGSIRVTRARAALFHQTGNLSSLQANVGEVISRDDPRFQVVLDGLRETGDTYLRRSRFHADAHGAMSEQFNRDTGYMQSAAELTWSHASVLTAAWERGK